MTFKITATDESRAKGFSAITLESLKENKAEIIAEIKSTTNDVKKVMQMMVAELSTRGNNFTDEIEYTKDTLCEMGYYNNASAELAELNRQSSIELMKHI